MKKFSFLMLLLLTALGVQAQRPSKVAPASMWNGGRITYDQIRKQLARDTDANMLQARGGSPSFNASPTASNKTNVSPIALGRASNAFSILRPEQNQVFANDALDFVCFVHRQDIAIFGGGAAANGKYRYDLSIDNGSTWAIDNGVLNATYTRPARYPNITGHNASGNTNPLETEFLFYGPVLDPSPDWDGHVYGITDATTSGTTTGTEHYDFLASNTLLPGGLCEGQTDEYWAVDFWYDGTNSGDSIYVYKGIYNASDITFTRTAIAPDHYTGFDGTVTAVGPNIAFSPDGNDGWIAWLGDLNGGQDSTMQPCLIHSTDGGDTWGTPFTLDLNGEPWVFDSLRTLWQDSLGGVAASGLATTGFDFDLTVDGNGDPHIAVVVGNATDVNNPTPGYAISPLAKFMADVSTHDGGATTDITYLAPVLTFRGEFGTPDPTDQSLLTIDNYCQISRDASGEHLFYGWGDSDTTIVGFGEANNVSPNLRITSMRVSDGFLTCYKLITDGDLVWDGKAFCPTMAPVVLTDINGYDYSLPIVMMEMLLNDQLKDTKFHYVGNNCYFMDADYQDPSTMQLSWDGACAVAANPDDIFANAIKDPNAGSVTSLQAYPNPTVNQVNVKFELNKSSEVSLTLANVFGQSVATIATGKMESGNHIYSVSTESLAPGIYFINLEAGASSLTEKLVIIK